MYETVVNIEGMKCSMCESHINQAVRAALPVKKVSSSHTKKRTIITSESPITESDIHRVIDPTGYTVVSVESHEEQGKHHLFGRRH